MTPSKAVTSRWPMTRVCVMRDEKAETETESETESEMDLMG